MQLENIPKDIAPGLVPTLNQFGLMTKLFDPYTEEFIELTSSLGFDGHVAELGAAYGAVSNRLLKYKAKITINDMDSRHIQLFLKNTEKKHHNNINISIGRIPHEVSFDSNSFDAILAARVLQYLTPDDFILTLKNIKRWVKPGGKIFIIMKTPYIRILKDFISIYDQKKVEGIRWPGMIDNLDDYNTDQKISHIVPKSIHVFDPDILQRSCREVGLFVEKCSFINRNDFPDDIKLTGKEEVGLIASKL